MNCALDINHLLAPNLEMVRIRTFSLKMDSRDIKIQSRLEDRLKLWTLQCKRSKSAHKEVALNTKQGESPAIECQ